MLIISLIACGVLFLTANLAAWSKGGLGSAGGVSAAFILVAFLCGLSGVFLPAFALAALLTAIVAGICKYTDATPRTFLKGSIGAIALSHLFVAIIVLPEVLERRDLRERYPIESMAERLAYETQKPGTSAGHSDEKDPMAGNDMAGELPVNQRLDDMENEVERLTHHSFRTLRLRALHQGTVEDFIGSPGFGISRGIRPSGEYIDLPKIESLEPPTPDYVPDAGASPAAAVAPASPAQDVLTKMHETGVTDFVNPAGFGYIRDRDHVTGFQPHHFRAVPSLADSKQVREVWQVQTLELVSLLKHPEPVAYVSKYLPRMDELRDAPTRPLDSFEKQALAVLRRGEDLKVDTAADQIRMLGSVRAVKQCMACHRVKRGELLGAFSYTLRRASREP